MTTDTVSVLSNLIGDKYHVGEVIARGGMGEVYTGTHVALNRKVAIKIIRTHLSSDAQIRERFLREARLTAQLTHPNIIEIFDFGGNEAFDYIIMPYIDGITLKDRLTGTGPVPADETLKLVRPVVDALALAHDRGVVHRDVKPSNILVTSGGIPILTDFGISKNLNDSDMTLSDTMLGAPRYMSPEQIRGERVDGRSDLYAIGIILYEMLCGSHPFKGDQVAAICYQQMHEVPSPPDTVNPAIPEWLSGLVMQLVEKKPEDRFLDAHALLKAMDAKGDVAAIRSLGSAQDIMAGDRTIVGDATRVGDATVVGPEPAAVSLSDATQIGEATEIGGPVVHASAGIPAAGPNRKRWYAIAGAVMGLLIIIGIAGKLLRSPDAEKSVETPIKAEAPVSSEVDTGGVVSPGSEDRAELEPLTEPVTRKDLIQAIQQLPVTGAQASGIHIDLSQPSFRVGDPIAYRLKFDRPGYGAAVLLTTSGELICLYPSGSQSGALVEPDRVYPVPHTSLGIDLEVVGPEGKERVVAFHSTVPVIEPAVSADAPFTEITDATPKLVKALHDAVKKSGTGMSIAVTDYFVFTP